MDEPHGNPKEMADALERMSLSEAINILEDGEKKGIAPDEKTLINVFVPILVKKVNSEIKQVSLEMNVKTNKGLGRMMTLLSEDIPQLTELAKNGKFPKKVYSNPAFQKSIQNLLIMMSDKIPPEWHRHYDYVGTLRNIYETSKFMPKERQVKTLKKVFGTLSFTWRSMDASAKELHFKDVTKFLQELSKKKYIYENPLYRSIVRITHKDYAISTAANDYKRKLSDEAYKDGHITFADRAALHDIYNSNVAENTFKRFEKLQKDAPEGHVRTKIETLINLAKFVTKRPGVDEAEIRQMIKIKDTAENHPKLRRILESADRGEQRLKEHTKTKSPESFLGLLAWLHKEGLLTHRELVTTAKQFNESKYRDAISTIRNGWHKKMDFDFKKEEMTPNFYARVPRGLGSGIVDYTSGYLEYLDNIREEKKQEMEFGARELLKNNPKIRRSLSMNEGVEEHYKPIFGSTPLLIANKSTREAPLLYNGKGHFLKLTENGITPAKPPWKTIAELHNDAISSRLGLERITLPIEKLPQVLKKV